MRARASATVSGTGAGAGVDAAEWQARSVGARANLARLAAEEAERQAIEAEILAKQQAEEAERQRVIQEQQAQLDAERGVIACRMCQRHAGLDETTTLWRLAAEITPLDPATAPE